MRKADDLAAELKPFDPGAALTAAAGVIRAFAHEPANHYDLRPRSWDWRPEPPPADCRFTLKSPEWETSIHYTYTIDLVPDLRSDNLDGDDETDDDLFDLDGPSRFIRHLTVQISVPGIVTQGMVNIVRPSFLEWFTPHVKPWFPIHSAVQARLQAGAPIPVVDSRLPRGMAPVHFRTPIWGHFLVDIQNMRATQ